MFLSGEAQRHRHLVGYVQVRGATTEYEVADVLRDYGDDYRQHYAVTPELARVMGALVGD